MLTTNDKARKTVNLEIEVYKKLRLLQAEMINSDVVPSLSYLVNMLIEKNKKHRQQIYAKKHEEYNHTN